MTDAAAPPEPTPDGDRAAGPEDRPSGSEDRPSGPEDRGSGPEDRASGPEDRPSGSGDRASGGGDRPSAPPALSPRLALAVALAATVTIGGAVWFAFRPEQAGTWGMLLALLGAQVPFAALAVALLAREGVLAAELRPHRGDLTFGFLAALLMYAAAMAVRQIFLGPDTPRSWWLARVYLQLGDTSENRSLYVGLVVLVIAALEELVWRGLVMRSLRPSMGPMRAWMVSSVLYGLAHAATIPLLGHPVAGPNPLLVAAAIGGGLVWGHLYNRTGRLGPALFAHALFSWAIVDFPLWRPM